MGRFERDFGSKDFSPGMRLIVLRRMMGLTQHDLAEAVGVDRSHISRLESDTRELTLELATDFAHALGVGVDDLLGSIVHQRTDRDVAVERDRVPPT